MANGKLIIFQLLLTVVAVHCFQAAKVPADQEKSDVFPADFNLTLIREVEKILPTPSRLNESCSTSSDCQHQAGFICENNICVCNPNNSIAISTECVGKAEKHCINNKCTPNAECLTYPGKHGNDDNSTAPKTSGGETINKTSPISQICKCTQGHYSTPTGLCENSTVDCTKLPCKAWLICRDNTACHCWVPQTTMINEVKVSCTAKINEKCNANLTKAYDPDRHVVCLEGGVCVKNSDFHDGGQAESNMSSSHCSCQEGLVQTDQGTCELGYGMACSTIKEGGKSSNLECDRKMKLACINGKCNCRENLNVYDEAEGRCVGLPGASCSINMTDADLNKTYYRVDGPGTGTVGNVGIDISGTCKEGTTCSRVGNGNASEQAQETGICRFVEKNSLTKEHPISASHWAVLAVALGTVVVIITVICLIYVRGNSFLAFMQARFL